MRRSDKEITDKSLIESIIGRSTVCRIAMVDDGEPYLVPVSFGYENDTIYIHGARDGRKMTILSKNPSVCFECETDVRLVSDGPACRWGMAYRSVIGFGTASFIHDREEKRRALAIIMRQYSDESHVYQDSEIDATAVIGISVTRMTGKQSG